MRGLWSGLRRSRRWGDEKAAFVRDRRARARACARQRSGHLYRHGGRRCNARGRDMQCPCATAANHGQYVHCVAGVAKAAVASGSLPEECRSAVVRCAANSTCGKPGFVTCCVTRNSVTRCHRTRRLCDAAKGGHIGACPSCCDACTGGCPTTTTSTLPCVFQAGFGCIPSGCDPGFECLALQPFSCQCVPVGSTSTSPPPAAAPAAR